MVLGPLSLHSRWAVSLLQLHLMLPLGALLGNDVDTVYLVFMPTIQETMYTWS